MNSMSRWMITPGHVHDDGIGEAIWDYAMEVSERVWGRPATEPEIRKALEQDPHDDLESPRGAFLVARADNGEVLGYVGVRLLADLCATAEVKRMYVRPSGRGMGLGGGLLTAAETAARELGAQRVVLETNTQLREARRLYEAHGYRETEPYNDHRAAEHWYVKTLHPAPLQ